MKAFVLSVCVLQKFLYADQEFNVSVLHSASIAHMSQTFLDMMSQYVVASKSMFLSHQMLKCQETGLALAYVQVDMSCS